jgi:hypothetical protein
MKTEKKSIEKSKDSGPVISSEARGNHIQPENLYPWMQKKLQNMQIHPSNRYRPSI